MTISLVQKTAQGGSSTGTTSIPAITASTAGTTLAAVLTSATGGTAFTQTTGTGWTQRATIANGTTVRCEVWTFENNPGGITAAQWTSGTGRVFGEISEWAGAGTVTLDGTPGTATTGSGHTTLAVTNGSANQAGDVGIAIFADQFSATVASSNWSTPSGWTALATLNSTSVTSAAAGYYKTGLPSGTVSVTGTYSSSTSSTGWAAIVATLKESVASLAVTTSSLAAATTAVPYSATVAASGGTSPYTWSVPSGSLPGGLSLNASTGAITGTPSLAGTYPFTVKVTDSVAATSTQALSVTVAAGAGRVAQLIGADVARGTWAAANTAIGPLDTHRLFATTLPASFDGDGTPSSVTVIQSYKTLNTNVASYCASVPGNRQVILIFHHEPEGDTVFSGGSDFVSQFKSQSALIRGQGRPNIRVAMCSAGFPYRNAGTADVLAGNYLRGLGPFVDMFTKDIYQGTGGVGGSDWPSNGLANYPAFQNWLALVTSASVVGTVQPLGISEYGVANEVGNAARLARIQLDHDYLAANFPGPASSSPLQLWCYWWQSIDVNDDQFTDAATQALWQSFETAATTPLAVTTGILAGATVGTAYSATLTAAGGAPAYTWSVSAGALPGGLSLNASTGAITGTPTTAGVFAFTVMVTDSLSSTDTQDLTLAVAATATALSVATTSLPDGTASLPYSQALAAAGGTPPYTWTLL